MQTCSQPAASSANPVCKTLDGPSPFYACQSLIQRMIGERERGGVGERERGRERGRERERERERDRMRGERQAWEGRSVVWEGDGGRGDGGRYVDGKADVVVVGKGGEKMGGGKEGGGGEDEGGRGIITSVLVLGAQVNCDSFSKGVLPR
ncbi:unnamed protein product [Closterium sp. NIES-54]